MDGTYVTLWEALDGQGNMEARARMVIGSQVFDETISVPVGVMTDQDLANAIQRRIAELQAGNFTAPDAAQQIIAPLNEVRL